MKRNKLFKNKGISLLCLTMLLVASLFSGCSSSNASNGSQQADTDKVYELDVNFTHGPDVAKSFTDWGAMIEEKSGGRIKFNYFYSNSLLSIPDLPKGVATGVADISNCPVHIYPGIFPLNGQILGLPFIGVPGIESGSEIYRELYSNNPEMQEEYEKLGVHMLTANMMSPYHIHTTSTEEIRTPDDLKGLKIITGKTELSELIGSTGGAPVSQPVTEYYLSLERGVADGVTAHFPVANAFGIIPLLKQHIIFGESGTHMDLQTYIFNKDAWDNLPEDLQKLFEDNLDLLNQYEIEITNQQYNTAMEKAMAQGDIFTELTDEEINEWKAMTKNINQETLEDIEDLGLPALKVYKNAKQLIESYK